MSRKFVLVWWLLLLSIVSSQIKAQQDKENLVYNPSYEEYHYCPPAHDDPYPAKGWEPILYSTPDYYHSCSRIPEFKVPHNWNGYCQSRTGKAYIGLFLINVEASDMELIQGHLIDTLKQDSIYKVSFWINLPHLESDYYAYNIGAYFSRRRIWQNDLWHSPLYYDLMDSTYRAHVSNDSGNYVTDTTWTKIEGIYKAQGGEKYITLGMFWEDHPEVVEAYEELKENPDKPKKYQKRLGKTIEKNILKPNPNDQIDKGEKFGSYPYYLIDDVSVVPIEADTIEPGVR